ncbi:MAG: hypothetical protein AAGA48_19150 [Myxococcota bacterium]
MADLVTHVCAVLLPGVLVRSRALGLVAVGTVLPDALGRAVPMALEIAQDNGVGIPDPVIWSFGAFHSPAGLLLASASLSQSFVKGQRTEAFIALTIGAAVHVLIDLLQYHHGRGYPLLAPFSWETYEIGVIGSEVTVDLALPLLAVTAALWAIRLGIRFWRQRNRSESTS